MHTFIMILAFPFGVAPFVLPPVLAVMLTVPRSRRWLLRPLTRRRAARRRREQLARQAAIEARIAELEAAAEVADLPKWTIE